MSEKHQLPPGCQEQQEKIMSQDHFCAQGIKTPVSSAGPDRPAMSRQPTSTQFSMKPPASAGSAAFAMHSKFTQGTQQAESSSVPEISHLPPKVGHQSSISPDIKKPRSPYNLFFLVERQLVMNDLSPEAIPRKHDSYLEDAIPQPELPARYRGAGIANPLVVIQTGRRKHRKVHGKIGFVQLCREIASRWKKTNETTKMYFQCLSKADLARFRRDIDCVPATIENDYQQQSKEFMKLGNDTRANAKGDLGLTPSTGAVQSEKGQCNSTSAAAAHPSFLVPNMNAQESLKRKATELPAQGNASYAAASLGGQKRSKTEIDVAHSLVSSKMFMAASAQPQSTSNEDRTKSVLEQKRSKAEIDVAHSLVSSKMFMPVLREPQKQVLEPDTVKSSSNEEKIPSKESVPSIPSGLGNSASLESLLNKIRSDRGSDNKKESACVPMSGDDSTSARAKLTDETPDHNGSQGMGFTTQPPMTLTPVLSNQLNHLDMPIGGLPVPSIPPSTFHPGLIPTISSFGLPWERQLDLYRVYLQTLFEHQIKNSEK